MGIQITPSDVRQAEQFLQMVENSDHARAIKERMELTYALNRAVADEFVLEISDSAYETVLYSSPVAIVYINTLLLNIERDEYRKQINALTAPF